MITTLLLVPLLLPLPNYLRISGSPIEKVIVLQRFKLRKLLSLILRKNSKIKVTAPFKMKLTCLRLLCKVRHPMQISRSLTHRIVIVKKSASEPHAKEVSEEMNPKFLKRKNSQFINKSKRYNPTTTAYRKITIL